MVSECRVLTPEKAHVAFDYRLVLYRVITSLSLINDPFLAFNTNQKPRKKSPKVGILRTKIIAIGGSPDPFSSRPNIYKKRRSGYARLLCTYCIIEIPPNF